MALKFVYLECVMCNHTFTKYRYDTCSGVIVWGWGEYPGSKGVLLENGRWCGAISRTKLGLQDGADLYNRLKTGYPWPHRTFPHWVPRVPSLGVKWTGFEAYRCLPVGHRRLSKNGTLLPRPPPAPHMTTRRDAVTLSTELDALTLSFTLVKIVEFRHSTIL